MHTSLNCFQTQTYAAQLLGFESWCFCMAWAADTKRRAPVNQQQWHSQAPGPSLFQKRGVSFLGPLALPSLPLQMASKELRAAGPKVKKRLEARRQAVTQGGRLLTALRQ